MSAPLQDPLFAMSAPKAPPPRRRARSGRWFVWLIVLGVLGSSAWFAVAPLKAWFAGDTQQRIITQRVTRGPLIVTVVEDGNVESAANVDVKCEVAGGSVILWIIPDGTHVTKGDKIVELDGSTISESVSQQKIVLEKANAARIQVEKEFSAAKIAVQEYLEGTYVKEHQLFESQAKVALENLRSAENALLHTERMARKGYVTPLQLEAQRFAVERAKLDLDTAQTAITVLDKFTKAKMLEDLQSKRDSAEARWRSEQAACKLEEQRLNRLTTQLEKCVILAPQDGMVIYANEMSSGRGSSSSGAKIEEGAAVRERQSIVRLPDLSQMQVKTLVHESKIEQVAIGQRAQIKLLDRVFQGQVRLVGNQPEPGSFFSSNVKEYAAYVRIEGEVQQVRPGQTAEVEILIADKRDVISVPVQAVVELGRKAYCWIRTPHGPERRPVVVGLSSSERIEIKDGLAEGDDVLLNPRAVLTEAREEVETTEQVDVNAKFGEQKESPSGAPKTDAPKKSSGAPTFNFSDLDKNGDKKLTVDELPERMAGAMDRLDTNSDGAVDATEFAAFRARMQSMKGKGPPQ
jgi:HlyD family secretion protein